VRQAKINYVEGGGPQSDTDGSFDNVYPYCDFSKTIIANEFT